MKRFVTYILLFAGLVLLSDFLMVVVTKKSIGKEAFQLPAGKNILVLGDSHLECAVNDSIVSNCVNLSHSGEAYIYTYAKMKVLLNENPQIDTVLLSFNFHSLLAESEKWLHDKNGVLNIDRYCLFVDEEEKEIFRHTADYYKSLFRIPYTYRHFVMNKLFSRQSIYENLRWGGYYPLDKNIGAEGKERATVSSEEDYDKTSLQTVYLDKIVAYCRKNNVCLIFVNSPVYAEHIDKKEEYYTYYAGTYADVPLWNYSSLQLPDSCYADTYHLNYKGAEIFSRIINERRRVGE